MILTIFDQVVRPSRLVLGKNYFGSGLYTPLFLWPSDRMTLRKNTPCSINIALNITNHLPSISSSMRTTTGQSLNSFFHNISRNWARGLTQNGEGDHQPGCKGRFHLVCKLWDAIKKENLCFFYNGYKMGGGSNPFIKKFGQLLICAGEEWATPMKMKISELKTWRHDIQIVNCTARKKTMAAISFIYTSFMYTSFLTSRHLICGCRQLLRAAWLIKNIARMVRICLLSSWHLEP